MKPNAIRGDRHLKIEAKIFSIAFALPHTYTG